ncbi:MAG: DUF6644 family protein [Steroidobacteraceae bacterium]
MDTFLNWLQHSWLAHLTLQYPWFFPTLQVLHFFGLCLLMGSVGLIDLRVLGFARRLSLPALYELLPWAFVGFAMNLVGGTFMFASDVHRYYPNTVFRLKMAFVLVAGLNALMYEFTVKPQHAALGPDADAPWAAKSIAATSVLLWMAIIITGRLITQI